MYWIVQRGIARVRFIPPPPSAKERAINPCAAIGSAFGGVSLRRVAADRGRQRRGFSYDGGHVPGWDGPPAPVVRYRGVCCAKGGVRSYRFQSIAGVAAPGCWVVLCACWGRWATARWWRWHRCGGRHCAGGAVRADRVAPRWDEPRISALVSSNRLWQSLGPAEHKSRLWRAGSWHCGKY